MFLLFKQIRKKKETAQGVNGLLWVTQPVTVELGHEPSSVWPSDFNIHDCRLVGQVSKLTVQRTKQQRLERGIGGVGPQRRGTVPFGKSVCDGGRGREREKEKWMGWSRQVSQKKQHVGRGLKLPAPEERVSRGHLHR